jgi:hypothetical protein
VVFGFLFAVMLVSCTKDFEELNKNPFQPTKTDIGPLFNTVVSSLRLGWNEQFYVHNEVLYQQTQQAALTAEAWSNLSLGTEEIWTGYYAALAHIRDIESRIAVLETQQDPVTLNNLKGMVKIVTAYKTFRVTDLFGDMPFFDAGRGFESIEYLRPRFDTQEEIYKFLLDELKWAAENIDPYGDTIPERPYYNIDEFDNLLYGDMEMWIKFANSLRLRHAMRMADKDPEYAGAIIGDIISNGLPVLVGFNLDSPVLESVCMWPSQQNWLRQSTSWSFREHKNLRMGTTVWKQMTNHDSLDGSGIFDPRAFIFFETNNDKKWAPYPQIPEANTPPEGGIPYGLHRDLNYTIKGDDCIYSPFNYYLTRDENDVPEVLITGAEVHYIKAEAYMRGIGVPADPSIADLEYFSGARASVEFWDNVMNSTSMWVNIDPGYASTNAFNVANLIFFTEDKLGLIYAQRWLDAFRQPWEAYALARRTGQTPREGDPINHFRLPYPPSEKENNGANCASAISNQGGDDPQFRIWWIPD